MWLAPCTSQQWMPLPSWAVFNQKWVWSRKFRAQVRLRWYNAHACVWILSGLITSLPYQQAAPVRPALYIAANFRVPKDLATSLVQPNKLAALEIEVAVQFLSGCNGGWHVAISMERRVLEFRDEWPVRKSFWVYYQRATPYQCDLPLSRALSLLDV